MVQPHVRLAFLTALMVGGLLGCDSSSSRRRSVVAPASTASTQTATTGNVTTSSNNPPPASQPSGSGAPVSSTSAPAPARIAITPHGLRIDGQTRLLFGGEVQYYRVRDRANDPARTHRMWAETLDMVVAAGMNLVTTYVPWDYHEVRQGNFQFSGVRDIEAFLELCHQRNLLVIFKPGPFINSEWPTGVGSFGAIPHWFKRAYPGAMALKPDGKPFSTDLFGSSKGFQPSYFAPELMRHVDQFFTQLAPIVRRYVFDKPTIMGIQIDNETNFYFSDRYTVDYSPHGIRQYRAWLQTKYGTISALNVAYGKSHASFDAVDPPRRAPGKNDPVSDNLWHQDWFDAGKTGIERYQLALRAIWERLGFREPNVLFFTNDSPHTMPKELGRENIVLWDGPTKNKAGIAALDAYPRQFPTTFAPLNYPFLTGFFSKRFASSNDQYRFAGQPPVAAGKCYSAELEGGLFEVPVVHTPVPVPASATDHVLLQHIGRGSALAAVYILRAGLNQDDTPYFSNAAISVGGRPQPKWAVLQRYGRLVSQHGTDLLRTQPVEADVAVAIDSRFDAPAGGGTGNPGRIQVNEATAVFGWLEDAGLDAPIVDLRHATAATLRRYRLVFFLNPDVVHEGVARLLDEYVRRGGHLVNLLHRGRHDARWQNSGSVTHSLLAQGLFGDARSTGTFWNRGLLDVALIRGNLNLRVSNGPSGAVGVGPFLEQFTGLTNGATPLAFDRTFPLGRDGKVVAWSAARGQGSIVHFGTNPASRYGSAAYYRTGAAELGRLRTLARWLASRAGARGPVVSVADSAGTAWARKLPGGGDVFVFLGSRQRSGATLRVDLHDLNALGLSSATQYQVVDTLTGATIQAGVSGADLARRGISVTLAPFGTAVLRIR